MPQVSWDPHNPAVFVEPAPTAPHIALIRHDGYPYVEDDWDEDATGFNALFDIANRYLALANERLHLPPAWLNDLLEEPWTGERPPALLHWLRDSSDPRHSYWVERHAGLDDASRPSAGRPLDRTAVLVAGLCWTLLGPWFPLYGGQGLRILAQVGPRQNGLAPVRISGVSSTLPLPESARIFSEALVALSERIADVFALPEEVSLVDVGISLPDGHTAKEQAPIIFAKTAPPTEYPRGDYSYEGTSYLLVMRANEKFPRGIEPLARRPLVTAADADVFVQDPISRKGAGYFTKLRPSRSWLVLDPERVNVPLGNLPPGAGANVQLVDPDPNEPPKPNFRVTNARLVDPPLAESNAKQVAASVHEHVRTNTFAAVNGFYHVGDLFSRMRRYGLPVDGYFKFIERPIDVRYRAGIIPGAGDGRAVNAQVRWTLRPDGAKGTIEVRFALGDLDSAVGRLPANKPSAAERAPLGVASDPRWCWHECCHVLLTAAVGELELRFAHSAGDALAAILCDPDSELARDQAGALANNGPWRGVTFPWVLIPRRHDRDVRDGWGWTGALNQRETYFTVPGLSDKRGYWAEQILSSSLFRLYRAIGGDSQGLANGLPAPAKAERGNAADYTAYLIMRTIQSLGPAAVTPCSTANDFVSVMRKVDAAPANEPAPAGRYVGGAVQKVIQWAFERQGLYGLPVVGSPVSGPEELATVDLHIEDLRAKPDGPYSPVDLLGTAWHADPNFLRVKSSIFPWIRKRKIRVAVQNRGVDPAIDTRVDVWVAVCPGGAIPSYPDAAWKPLGSTTHTVPGAKDGEPGLRTFGTFAWTPPAGPGTYAILAAATCDADRSNIDKRTGYPCATVKSPTNILVACDNNLGLITVAME